MKTKIELVKDVFFAATDGKREPKNYPDGMWLIEQIAANNSAPVVRGWWEDFCSGKESARRILSRMAHSTEINVSGVNGPTNRSKAVREAYYRFI